jgi:hypothetical protein
MARPKSKKSDLSFGGYGLKPEEDKELMKLLESKGISAKMLVRNLLRQWVKEGGPGVITYQTAPKIYPAAKH